MAALRTVPAAGACDRAKEKHGPADVLARRLFDLGATQVTIYSSAVTVQAPPERWPELEPKVTETIEHLFGYYGDDAGWSPDALEALGIEVKPPPEPQK